MNIPQNYKNLINSYSKTKLIGELSSLERMQNEHIERGEKIPPHTDDYQKFVSEKLLFILNQ